jgi:hypothetical protein
MTARHLKAAACAWFATACSHNVRCHMCTRRCISSGGRGAQFRNFLVAPYFGGSAIVLCALQATRCTALLQQLQQLLQWLQSLIRAKRSGSSRHALLANIFSRCSAVCSCYIVPLLLIKRSCRRMMPRSKARCPRCNVFTRSCNCFCFIIAA